jgi:hypothetical protein
MKNLLIVLLAVPLLLTTARASEKTEVMATAKKAVIALKNKNMIQLAAMAHPVKGIRFTPYNFVNTDQGGDLVFKGTQIAGLWASQKRYLWGEFDGSGDPIRMTFAKYFGRFIFSRDFANAHTVVYNQAASPGTTIDNFADAYPKAKFVGYHFSRSKDGNDMGWETLYLIFEKSGKKWYLVGISHDEWTI